MTMITTPARIPRMSSVSARTPHPSRAVHTRLVLSALALVTLAATTACAPQPGVLRAMDGGAGMAQMGGTASMAQMERMMDGWPTASREAVMFMTKKYGAPAAMTSEMAMWGKTGPWKRTVVFAREYAHAFPMQHTDVMQQWLDYRAPAAMYDELAQYDGSVVLERTSGEMSARCDKEAANFLAVNLAHDVATGRQTVAAARMMYGEQIMALKAGRAAPYTEGIRFSMMSNTGDPDHAHAAPMTGGGRP